MGISNAFCDLLIFANLINYVPLTTLGCVTKLHEEETIAQETCKFGDGCNYSLDGPTHSEQISELVGTPPIRFPSCVTNTWLDSILVVKKSRKWNGFSIFLVIC